MAQKSSRYVTAVCQQCFMAFNIFKKVSSLLGAGYPKVSVPVLLGQ